MSETKPSAAPVQPGSKLVTELKVSGHLMTFDAGLFCIFNAPGGPLPDPATGLPGVRVSLPPGPAFRPEAVSISTFRDDGWIGGWNGAALVRVARGPAQVLVTIYQAPNSTAEAPKLQIIKLQDGVTAPAGAAAARPAAKAAPTAAAEAAAAVPATADDTPGGSAALAADGEITAHIQTRGDVTARLGAWVGEPGSRNWIEGFSIAPKAQISAADIEYQAVLGRGWLSPWSEGGNFCGSRGMSLPILGLRARLRGAKAEEFDCVLSASFVDGTKLGPIDNGEPAQAESLAPLEAFLIELRPRAAGAAAKPAAKAAPKPAEKPAAKAPAKKK